MHQVQLELTDDLYEVAVRRSVAAGFNTIGEYIVDVLADDLATDDENLDRLFTPERLAHIDNVIVNVRAGGKTHSVAEVREHFRKRF